MNCYDLWLSCWFSNDVLIRGKLIDPHIIIYYIVYYTIQKIERNEI